MSDGIWDSAALGTLLIVAGIVVTVASCIAYGFGKSAGRHEVIGWIKKAEEEDWQRKLRNVVRAQEGKTHMEPKAIITWSNNSDRNVVERASEEVIAEALQNLRDYP